MYVCMYVYKIQNLAQGVADIVVALIESEFAKNLFASALGVWK